MCSQHAHLQAAVTAPEPAPTAAAAELQGVLGCVGGCVSIRQEDQPRTSTLFQFEMSRMPTGSKLELGKHGHARCHSYCPLPFQGSKKCFVHSQHAGCFLSLEFTRL